jgi:transcriptional regulator with XRE-family HTH domain
MTQVDVATDFLRTRQAVSKWENGQLPTLSEFRELALLYGTSADYLLFGLTSPLGSIFLRAIQASQHQAAIEPGCSPTCEASGTRGHPQAS